MYFFFSSVKIGKIFGYQLELFANMPVYIIYCIFLSILAKNAKVVCPALLLLVWFRGLLSQKRIWLSYCTFTQFLGEKRINGSFWEIHVISCFPTADIPFLSSEDKWHCFSLTGWILKCTPAPGMLEDPDMRAAPANTHSRVSSPLKCALLRLCSVESRLCVRTECKLRDPPHANNFSSDSGGKLRHISPAVDRAPLNVT